MSIKYPDTTRSCQADIGTVLLMTLAHGQRVSEDLSTAGMQCCTVPGLRSLVKREQTLD